jgi:hypothetical protein
LSNIQQPFKEVRFKDVVEVGVASVASAPAVVAVVAAASVMVFSSIHSLFLF